MTTTQPEWWVEPGQRLVALRLDGGPITHTPMLPTKVDQGQITDTTFAVHALGLLFDRATREQLPSTHADTSPLGTWSIHHPASAVVATARAENRQEMRRARAVTQMNQIVNDLARGTETIAGVGHASAVLTAYAQTLTEWHAAEFADTPRVAGRTDREVARSATLVELPDAERTHWMWDTERLSPDTTVPMLCGLDRRAEVATGQLCRCCQDKPQPPRCQECEAVRVIVEVP